MHEIGAAAGALFIGFGAQGRDVGLQCGAFGVLFEERRQPRPQVLEDRPVEISVIDEAPDQLHDDQSRCAHAGEAFVIWPRPPAAAGARRASAPAPGAARGRSARRVRERNRDA
ncbi:MAG: hypothetical protein EB084_20855 [Proteobacteria bacterium]|nr:hypothetical protein [Pseudomonadota bacterium]